MPEQSKSQYAAAANVPLIKSPGLRVPRPVELPLDIHPLPESVTPYFVYPFTLEPHVLTVESSRRTTIAAHTARREAYLRAREDERQRRKREALRKIAPGFEPTASPLVPMSVTSPGSRPLSTSGDFNQIAHSVGEGEDSINQLIDQLAALESTKTESSS